MLWQLSPAHSQVLRDLAAAKRAPRRPVLGKHAGVRVLRYCREEISLSFIWS